MSLVSIQYPRTAKATLLAKFSLLLFFCLIGCHRKKKPEKKENLNFQISIPLPEDYSFMVKSIQRVILEKVPKADIKVNEVLSGTYEVAPVEDWLTKAASQQILELVITFSSQEERKQVTAFLNSQDHPAPFKLQLSPLEEGTLPRGENPLCYTRYEDRDLYERELCRSFVQNYCPSEAKTRRKKNGELPLCRLRFRETEQSASSPKLDLMSLRELKIASFPIPLRYNSTYPLSKLDEIDIETLNLLFQPSSQKTEL